MLISDISQHLPGDAGQLVLLVGGGVADEAQPTSDISLLNIVGQGS